MKRKSSATKSFRLKPEVHADYQERDAFPKQDALATCMRKKHKYRGQIERELYPALKRRWGVPKEFAILFCKYLAEELDRKKASFDEMFEETVPVDSIGIWDHKGPIERFAEGHKDDNLMYVCDLVEDTLLAARLHLDTVGFKTALPDEPRDVESCIKRGEQVMMRTQEEYAEHLRTILKVHPRAVMFYLHKKKRIGTIVAFAVTESSWLDVAESRKFDLDLTGDDMERGSTYLYAMAMSDAERANINSLELSASQYFCIFACMANLLHGIDLSKSHVSLLGLAVNEKYERVFEKQSWKPTGYTMKGTPYPMYMQRHPADIGSKSLKDFFAYHIPILAVQGLRYIGYVEKLNERFPAPSW